MKAVHVLREEGRPAQHLLESHVEVSVWGEVNLGSRWLEVRFCYDL